jgi:DNA-binding SARP family transcriptional activator
VNASEALYLEVLGPVRAWTGDREILLGSPMERAVLSALALRRGLVVSRGWLVDAVWGERHPASAVNSVHVYIGRLRRAFEPVRTPRDPGRILVTEGSGYSLRLGPGQVDTEVFSRHMERARQCRSAGNLDECLEALDTAMELWRGQPLDGVPGPFASAERTRLEELRITVAQERASVLLDLGRQGEALPEIGALIAEYPVREELRAMQMLALFRSGRQAEALEAYADARRVLVEELGIEPGAGLRRLHEQVLAGDPALSGVPALPVWTGPGLPPRQLPVPVPRFIGREPELAALDGIRLPMIAVIGGMAGAGKTALAVHWAHHAAPRFPDGQLYVNLHGFGPSGEPVAPARVIRGFLDALGVPPSSIPVSYDAQTALYRSLLAGRRALIVLDNARDAAQVRPLLPGSAGCAVLVTSRHQLTSLVAAEGACPLTLGALSETQARELLAGRLGADRAAAEPAAVTELAAHCAQLPLALSIAAARAASRPFLPLSALAAELGHAPGRLAALDAGEAASSLRHVFSWSYQHLTAPQARMFRLLGTHPGPDVSAPAAASLAGLPVSQACRLLRALSRVHLLAEHAPGRFATHDLLRAYAAEQAEREALSERRMLDHYLHTAAAAALLLDPGRDRLTLPAPHSGVTPEDLAGPDEALSWFQAEHRVLLAVIGQAAASDFGSHTWQLSSFLATYLYRQGHWDDWAATQRTALAAARDAGDVAGQARASLNLGAVCSRLGRYEEATVHLRQALSLYEQAGEHTGQAWAHRTLASVSGRQGRYADALGHARRTLALLREPGTRTGEAIGMNVLAWAHALAGQYHEALRYGEEALGLSRQAGDSDGEAIAWGHLGYTHYLLGQQQQAIACYQRALGPGGEPGGLHHRADILLHLGDARNAVGDPSAARDAWQQSLRIFDRLRHPGARQVRARLAGLDRAASSHR